MQAHKLIQELPTPTASKLRVIHARTTVAAQQATRIHEENDSLAAGKGAIALRNFLSQRKKELSKQLQFISQKLVTGEEAAKAVAKREPEAAGIDDLDVQDAAAMLLQLNSKYSQCCMPFVSPVHLNFSALDDFSAVGDAR